MLFFHVLDIYYKSDGMPERQFRGKLRVIDGDTYTPELADQSSLRFQHKAKFYQDGIDAIINQSDLKAGFQKCEVLALDGYVLSCNVANYEIELPLKKIAFFLYRSMETGPKIKPI